MIKTSLAALLVLVHLASPISAGDRKVKGQVSLDLPNSQRDAIIGIAKMIDPVAGAAIQSAVNSGGVTVARLSDAPSHLGDHDKNTILINTTYYTNAAMAAALLHEWRHIERIPSEAPEETQDGDDDTCDVCAHARNHSMTSDDVICAAMMGLITPEEACRIIPTSDQRGAQLWGDCQRYSSCQEPGTAPDSEDQPYSALGTKPRPNCPPPQ